MVGQHGGLQKDNCSLGDTQLFFIFFMNGYFVIFFELKKYMVLVLFGFIVYI